MAGTRKGRELGGFGGACEARRKNLSYLPATQPSVQLVKKSRGTFSYNRFPSMRPITCIGCVFKMVLNCLLRCD